MKTVRRPKAPRRRRDPETARTELMDAAERIFTRRPPDAAGLKQVADEAGVSHALITHYFGTYRGLVEETLRRRFRALRLRVIDRMVDAGALARPRELLGLLFETLEDPVHLRLLRWLLANERASGDTLGLQEQGLRIVANQLAAAIAPVPSPELIGKLELMLLTAVSAAYGYATGKQALAGALGRRVSRELDTGVLETLAAMVQSYLRHEVGLPG